MDPVVGERKVNGPFRRVHARNLDDSVLTLSQGRNLIGGVVEKAGIQAQGGTQYNVATDRSDLMVHSDDVRVLVIAADIPHPEIIRNCAGLRASLTESFELRADAVRPSVPRVQFA